jgi:hypothetical protein
MDQAGPGDNLPDVTAIIEEAASIRGVELGTEWVGEIQGEGYITIAGEACCGEILPTDIVSARYGKVIDEKVLGEVLLHSGENAKHLLVGSANVMAIYVTSTIVEIEDVSACFYTSTTTDGVNL